MCSVVSHILQSHQVQPAKAPVSMGFSRQAPVSMGFSKQNTVVGCHFLLQGIFLIQGSNPQLLYLLHYRWILYLLSHRRNP